MKELALRFAALFSGLERAHGIYKLTGERRGSKVRGEARTRHYPVTIELWEAHLFGEQGLGIIPIRDDGTCGFGAIDVDKYDLDLPHLVKQIHRLKLPLVPCRTKSGGAHLYLFGLDIDSPLLRSRLGEFSIALGYGGSEIFPKQDQLISKEDVGNWINMPYFDAERTMRYGLDADGAALSPEAFLTIAEAARITQQQLIDWDIKVGDDFKDGPPCLQHLSRVGFPEGSRNNALFSCGVYAKRSDPDNWEQLVWDFNKRFMTPGEPAEVKACISSLRRKDYTYLCGEPPLRENCAKEVCLKREFGIGTNIASEVVIDGVTKHNTSPPVYYVNANGHRLRMDYETLISQYKFLIELGKRVNRVIPKVKPTQWAEIVNEALETLTEVDAPEDASEDGAVWRAVGVFCTRAPANDRDEVMVGRPWTDEKGWTWFQSEHLKKWLTDRGYRVKPHTLWALLRDHRAKKKGWNVKGSFINVWAVPKFDHQTEPLSVPKSEGEL